MPLSRRRIIRACKNRGWTLQPAALEGIQDLLDEQQPQRHEEDGALEDVLDVLSEKLPARQRVVTGKLLEETFSANDEGDVVGADKGKKKKDRSAAPLVVRTEQMRSQCFFDLQVVSAFRTPKLTYDTMRKQFCVEQKTWPLFGKAEDKINMLAQRYALIHQRILRHELFRPTDLLSSHSDRQSGGAGHRHRLTPIESLLGKRSRRHGAVAGDTVLLLGALIQIEEGHYYLEDPTGQVPVSFQEMVTFRDDDEESNAGGVDGFYVTEHCILLAEGCFQDGIFYAQRLGPPLLEERSTTLQAIQQQLHHPAFDIGGGNPHQEEAAFVVVSDLYLDQPRTVSQLEGILAGYENYSAHRLPCFVLMGNFASPHSLYRQGGSTFCAVRSLLNDELGTTIAKFPNLARHAHFVLVPGPGDHVSDQPPVLPWPALAPSHAGATATTTLEQRVPHCHWATNPCRIRWAGQEMVVFRYDLQHLLQQEQVLSQLTPRRHSRTSTPVGDGMVEDGEGLLDDDDERHRQPHCRLVKTIVDQGHLVPTANVPVYWNYNHALYLYPLPSVLVLGGDAAVSSSFHEIYGGCHVINPGSMGMRGSYAVYRSASAAVKRSRKDCLDDGDDDSDYEMGDAGPTVDFEVVGMEE